MKQAVLVVVCLGKIKMALFYTHFGDTASSVGHVAIIRSRLGQARHLLCRDNVHMLAHIIMNRLDKGDGLLHNSHQRQNLCFDGQSGAGRQACCLWSDT